MSARPLPAALAAALLLALAPFGPGSVASADQVVLLDFDSGTDSSRGYTTDERNAVQQRMAGFYSLFDVTFTQEAPTAGDFSRVTFNAGAAGGLAQSIDFRNLDRTDTAVVNVDGVVNASSASSQQWVNASAGIGAHELGHLMGLRHHDSFGPIGSGPNPGTGTGPFLPDYPGPANGTETTDHIMASPASVGSSADDLQTPSWFSERSAIKLALAGADDQNVIAEAAGAKGTIATAQAIDLLTMAIPNTIVDGVNAGEDLFAAVAAVTGSIDAAGEFDLYEFTAAAGQIINVEVMSDTLDRIANSFDTQVSLLDSLGNVVQYFGADATNDDELENFDSFLMDVTLEESGTYYLQVSATTFFGTPTDTGDYEMFVSAFGPAAVPEPGTWGLIGLAVVGAAARRRKRRGVPAAGLAA